MSSPEWVSRKDIDILAETLRESYPECIVQIRDENSLESALCAPKHALHYGGVNDLLELASAYLFHLIKNHPYADGNKRIGLLVTELFLKINLSEEKGVQLLNFYQDVYEIGLDVASGKISKKDEVVTELRKKLSFLLDEKFVVEQAHTLRLDF